MAWCDFLGSETIRDDVVGNTDANRAKWVEMQEQGAPQESYTSAAALQSTFFELN